MMENNNNKYKVCVTGGAGHLASFLIKHLLERGYIVHATLRTLRDASKVGFLQDVGASAGHDTRLKLFEADIYNPCEFAAAVEGCQFVVHMATPTPTPLNYNKNTSEAAVGVVKFIMETCLKSNCFRKLIYTASVMAASPLKHDGSGGYKYLIAETCWTPLNLSHHQLISDYVHSKTLAEKEVLSYNGKGIEVVSLACGLVGGDTIQSFMPRCMGVLISQATNDGVGYKILRSLEDLVAKVPIAHIEDVIEAHIFSMENPHINGRFLCASDFLKSTEIAALIHKCQPNISIPQEFIDEVERETWWGSRKLEDLGFQYKCDAEKIIHDSLICAKRLGNII